MARTRRRDVVVGVARVGIRTKDLAKRLQRG